MRTLDEVNNAVTETFTAGEYRDKRQNALDVILQSLPDDRLIIPADHFTRYRNRLENTGAVYVFTYENPYTRDLSTLYVGITCNAYKRIREHVNNAQRGNKALGAYIKENPGVYVSIYFESNTGWREQYEGALITRYAPLFNTAKQAEEKEGYALTYPVAIQDEVIALYLAGVSYREIQERVGLNKRVCYTILTARGVELTRNGRRTRY